MFASDTTHPYSSDSHPRRRDQRELVEFVFRTCKVTDKGDELEQGELARLARCFHLSNNAFWPAFSQQLADITRAHANGDVLLTLDYFSNMHHKFPMILYPALRMQVCIYVRGADRVSSERWEGEKGCCSAS